MTATVELCPHCEVAATLVRERHAVPLGTRRVEIDDEFFRCSECAEEFYSPEQADLRQRRVIERARAEDNLLAPSQIKSIREELGLSQRLFERLLGVGEKTCVRWEQGRVCQSVATDRLVRLIAADRENVHRLAAINGVPLPDSCFVPRAEERASAYAGALAAWERDFGSSFGSGEPIALGGTLERELMSTAEHQAILEGAQLPVTKRPIGVGYASEMLFSGQGKKARRGT